MYMYSLYIVTHCTIQHVHVHVYNKCNIYTTTCTLYIYNYTTTCNMYTAFQVYNYNIYKCNTYKTTCTCTCIQLSKYTTVRL